MDPALALRQLVHTLERSQWAGPELIAASQFSHLGSLATHAAMHSPDFARRLDEAGLRPEDLAEPGALQQLPVLTRRSLQSAGDGFFCSGVPPGHGEVRETRTSGSTGEPVVVRRTGVNRLFWQAMTMRLLRWHRYDQAGRLCTIRANVSRQTSCTDWGPPASLFGATGSMLTLPIMSDAAQLAAWLQDFSPTLLAIYPSTLDALTAYCERHGVHFAGLLDILSIGETLSPAVRARAQSFFGVPVADCYSSQEFGCIAIECPASGSYHVMGESLITEVVNDDGTPCGEGHIGRVMLTDLHNYATPLIRYAIGDYAEPAPACSCGRGLPTWRRIVGRERNLMRMPDGTRRWPVTGFLRCRDVAPVIQYQLIQEDAQTITARLVVERPLSTGEEDGLTRLLRVHVGYPFTLRFEYINGRLLPGASGKFEEFVCAMKGHD